MNGFGDNESIGSQQNPGGEIVDMPLTFVMLQRARIALAAYEGGNQMTMLGWTLVSAVVFVMVLMIIDRIAESKEQGK